MNQYEINAEKRDVQGKGASRRLRLTGNVPAVLYGAGKDAVNIQLKHNDVLQHTEHEAFYSSILTLNCDGKSERVVLKDMQRHPFKAQIMHMDFLRIDESSRITMRVPLHFINEEDCIGVRSGGGIIGHLLTELEVMCLPKDLPEYIEVDVLDLELGETIHLSTLQMPEGVEIAALVHGGDPAQPVVGVQHPTVIADAETVEGEEEGEVGGEEAPAAEGDATEGDD